MQKAIDGIEANIKKAEAAIEDAKKSAKESTELDIWTINAMIHIIESQIIDLDNQIFNLND